jgi:hypothetical protein
VRLYAAEFVLWSDPRLPLSRTSVWLCCSDIEEQQPISVGGGVMPLGRFVLLPISSAVAFDLERLASVYRCLCCAGLHHGGGAL